MTPRILFVSVYDIECDLQVQIGRHLEAHGYSVGYVTLSRKAERRHAPTGVDILWINHLMPTEAVETSPAGIAQVEATYGLLSLRQVFCADRASRGKSETVLTVRTLQYFRAWETYFDKNPDVACVIPDIGAELIRRTLYFVCRRRSIPQVFWFTKPFPNSLILVRDDVNAAPVLPEDLRPLEPAEREEVETFLRRFRENTDPFVPIRYPEVSLRRFLRFFRLVYDATVIEQGQHDSLTPVRFLRKNLRRVLTAKAARLLYKRPDQDQPYAYFPLHVAEDFKISVMVPQFSDQTYVARLCAASLPQGYRLYVKEHPSFVGGESFGELKRLTRTGSIVLVPPETSNRVLIQRAAAVIVISSSAGLEGLFYERPVVTFGKPFYAGLGLTHDVLDLAETPRVLKRALSGPPPERERLYRFLHAMMRVTYPGRPPVNRPTAENLALVADSLGRKLQTVLKHQIVARGEA